MNKALISMGFVAVAAAVGCSSATPSSRGGAAPTPTPSASAAALVNPYVVEETETYTIQRYPKDEYIRVDDRHIRHPNLAGAVEFFREDDRYYYVSVPKHIPEEDRLKRERGEVPVKLPPVRLPNEPTEPGPPLSDFADLFPPRKGGRVRLEKLAPSGLPEEGLWRASFVVADVNEDGIPDIVSPPSRIGGFPFVHAWTGDGKGKFARFDLSYADAGKDNADAGVDYGAVAVGDIDRDGHADIVSASHGGGLVSFFGDGKGRFRIVRAGLPGREYSAQAVVLLDANRDGRLDIVASRDIYEGGKGGAFDQQQVRVYINQGARGWQFHDGLAGGFYSNSLHAWDYDGDGLTDVLTGSHIFGVRSLLWRSDGKGGFSFVTAPPIELHAYHFATVPGTFGRDRASAFADAYYLYTEEPELARAAGISVYAFRNGTWTRHRVWRKKESKTLQYGLAMGDLDGDGLDDVVFPDSEERRLKIFFQQSDGSFVEAAQSEEPSLDSPGQCVRLADLDRDGRLDIVLAKTVSSVKPDDRGGWDVYLNKR